MTQMQGPPSKITAARSVAVAVAVGAATGLLVSGGGARLSMRLIALADRSNYGRLTDAGFNVGFVTREGTLEVLKTGIFVGIIGGLLYLAVRRWLPGSGMLRATAYGVLLLLLGTGVNIFGNRGDFDFLPKLLSISLFGGLFLLYGILTALLVDRFANPIRGSRSAAGYVALGLLAGAGLALSIVGVVAIN